jgi:hypothetical protein
MCCMRVFPHNFQVAQSAGAASGELIA